MLCGAGGQRLSTEAAWSERPVAVGTVQVLLLRKTGVAVGAFEPLLAKVRQQQVLDNVCATTTTTEKKEKGN